MLLRVPSDGHLILATLPRFKVTAHRRQQMCTAASHPLHQPANNRWVCLRLMLTSTAELIHGPRPSFCIKHNKQGDPEGNRKIMRTQCHSKAETIQQCNIDTLVSICLPPLSHKKRLAGGVCPCLSWHPWNAQLPDPVRPLDLPRGVICPRKHQHAHYPCSSMSGTIASTKTSNRESGCMSMEEQPSIHAYAGPTITQILNGRSLLGAGRLARCRSICR